MAADLWEQAPEAEFLFQGDRILRLNRAARDLLMAAGLDPAKASTTGELVGALFSERHRQRFQEFLKNEMKYSTFDSLFPDGRQFYFRAAKCRMADGSALISLQDIADIQLNAEALRAGYDEFLKLSTDLEAALGTIAEQNRQLEKQKKTLEEEMQLAHALQDHVFAQDFGRYQTVRIAGYYRAMEQLGGDLWEFYEGESFFAGMGDVMGHGIAAALISVASKTLLKKGFEGVDQGKYDLGEMGTSINQELLEITNGSYYVTAALVCIHRDHTIQLMTCGHPAILLVPAGGGPVEVAFTEQPMLGIIPGTRYHHIERKLNPGDRIFLYTDCLIETISPEGEPIDPEELSSLLHLQSGSPQSVIDNVLQFLRKHQGSDRFNDDLAMLCIEIPMPAIQPVPSNPVAV